MKVALIFLIIFISVFQSHCGHKEDEELEQFQKQGTVLDIHFRRF